VSRTSHSNGTTGNRGEENRAHQGPGRTGRKPIIGNKHVDWDGGGHWDDLLLHWRRAGYHRSCSNSGCYNYENASISTRLLPQTQAEGEACWERHNENTVRRLTQRRFWRTWWRRDRYNYTGTWKLEQQPKLEPSRQRRRRERGIERGNGGGLTFITRLQHSHSALRTPPSKINSMSHLVAWAPLSTDPLLNSNPKSYSDRNILNPIRGYPQTHVRVEDKCGNNRQCE